MTSKINPAAEAEAVSPHVRKRRIPVRLWVAAPLVVAGDFNDWGNQIKRMLAGFGLFEFDLRWNG